MITKGDVFKEIISPSEAEKLGMEGNDLLIYKAQYMNIRLSLDIRQNQVRISNGEKLTLKTRPATDTRFDNEPEDKAVEVTNTVIKKTDKVEVKSKNDV